MDPTVLLWILGILVTVVIGLAVAIFNHVRDCREPHSHIARLESDMERVKQDIGTHDTGIRGHVHKLDSLVNASLLEIELMKRKRDER